MQDVQDVCKNMYVFTMCHMCKALPETRVCVCVIEKVLCVELPGEWVNVTFSVK